VKFTSKELRDQFISKYSKLENREIIPGSELVKQL